MSIVDRGMEKVILTLLIGLKLVSCTVNLNLEQLEYVADHLKVEDCRKLLAALHDPNFELTTDVNVAEWKVPQDVSCLKLLLHWNSEPGEGKGQTHLILTHRLEQLGHSELADWLSKSVFHQLAQDSERAIIHNPFKALLNDTNATAEAIGLKPTESVANDDDWMPLDTLACAFILVSMVVVASVIACACGKFCYRKCCSIIQYAMPGKKTWMRMNKISEQEDGKSILVYSSQQHSSEEDLYSYNVTQTEYSSDVNDGIKKPLKKYYGALLI